MISSVTFVECRVTGSYIFPFSLSLSLSLPVKSIGCFFFLWEAQTEQEEDSELCWQRKQSRAEMLLGKEVGKSQKPSPLSSSAHMTLRPERASGRISCVGSMRWCMHWGIWKAEWSAGLWSLALHLSECKLTEIKLLKVNIIFFFFLVCIVNLNYIRRKLPTLWEKAALLICLPCKHGGQATGEEPSCVSVALQIKRACSGTQTVVRQAAQRRCLPRKQPLVRNRMKEKGGEKSDSERRWQNDTWRTEMLFFFFLSASLCMRVCCLYTLCLFPLALS